MATSTALRIRNRDSSSSLSVLDAIGNVESNQVRLLSESINVSDEFWATEVTKRTGDYIASFSDLQIPITNINGRVLTQSIGVVDTFEKGQSVRRTIAESTTAKDDGFITDRDLLRFRTLEDDTIALEDGFIKSITITPSVTNFVVKQDRIDISDTFVKTFLGIIVKVLSDFTEVVDYKLLESDKKLLLDTAAMLDTIEHVKEVNRILADQLPVSDDTLVTRTAILNSVVVSDSINIFFDQLNASRVEYVQISATILHGIENQ